MATGHALNVMAKSVIVDALAVVPSIRAQRLLAVFVRMVWRGFRDS